jgi:NADH dehydrogenase FAD-containing subunit
MDLKEAVTDFKVGDPVEIWNFGALVWTTNWRGRPVVKDIMPELVGQRGVIDGEIDIQGMKHYSVEGPIKHA